MDSFVNFFKRIPEKFASSAKELGKVQTIAVLAMLLAVRVILGMFGNFQLAFLPYAKIGFTFIPMALVAYFFGPVSSMIVAAAGDILSIVLVPAGSGASFTPGITAGYVLEGLILGLILYKEKVGFVRSGISFVASTIVGGLAINTYFIYLFYGLTYFQVLGLRAAILIPWCIVETIIFVAIATGLNRVPVIKKSFTD